MLARTRDDPAGFVDVLRRGLRLSLFIGLPASVGLIVVRHDLIEVIYGSGSRSFSAEGIARCAAVLMGFAPAVWAYSLNHVFTRAFYALGDTTTPMKLACGSVVLNLVLNLTLIWHLREAGLAWATATSAMVQCVVLGALLRRKLHRMQEGHERVLDQTTVRAFVRIACIAAFMGACVFGVQLGFGARQTWMQHALCLAACVGAGAIAYAGLSRVLGAPELRWLLTKAPKGSGAAEGMSLEG
jgi:peptidoglycan biosynthesis protein MviN/MurJ (putative lipid II flippase)